MHPSLERGENRRAQAAGSCTDFQDPQPAPFRECARCFRDRCGNGGQPMTRKQTITIELLEQFRADAGEQHLHRVLLTAQNRPELSAISRDEQRFGKMSGMRFDKGALRHCRSSRRVWKK